MEREIKCPKCSSTQLTADKKGFSGKKAVAGALLTGGIGLLAGTIGSNKVMLTCLSCGHQFQVGQDLDAAARKKKIEREQQDKMMKSPIFWIVFIGGMILILRACIS